MSDDEYRGLLAKKQVALEAHRLQVTGRRQQIADVVLSDFPRALEAARRTLGNKTAPQFQWSRKLWTEIIETWPAERISRLLVTPEPAEEALADSHPFAGLR